MKKIILITLSVIIINLLMPAFYITANAIDDTSDQEAALQTNRENDQKTTPETVDSLKEATFDVTDILKLEGQPQSYFSKGDSPIVSAILMFIEFATRIIGILAVILLIIAGFMFMTAQGNQQNIDNAKDVVKYAVIGLAVTFLSYVMITFIQSMFTQ